MGDFLRWLAFGIDFIFGLFWLALVVLIGFEWFEGTLWLSNSRGLAIFFCGVGALIGLTAIASSHGTNWRWLHGLRIALQVGTIAFFGYAGASMLAIVAQQLASDGVPSDPSGSFFANLASPNGRMLITAFAFAVASVSLFTLLNLSHFKKT
ncbi:MAG: hypothetical protein VYD57_17870 [Pseudomonadota bacterium]|nr:hypothetical protein [Pseudomonadota bacterium]